MLLYVLESKGSSPGRQGFFMAVNAKGKMEGSIGGGIMEHKFVEMAKEKLAERQPDLLSPKLRKQVHNKQAAANQSGMICSGEQTILLYPVKSTDAEIIDQLIESVGKFENGTLVFSPAGMAFTQKVPAENFEFSMTSEKDWLYREKSGPKNKLFIVGGGHCALALSRLASSLDFFIQVYDERKELKTMIQNEYAHRKHFVDEYSELAKHIPSGADHYVVIMTFGYRTDDQALRALRGKEFAYLGVLGSADKMKKLFETYQQEGLDTAWLKKIHSPIGIQIKSQTPEEIAVSIAAEIIREKNKHYR
jgi:xanthine dehydrogenase accessory factor